MSQGQGLLSVKNVSFAYGSACVLFDVTLLVPESQVVALLGANGAGKSTLLRVISRILPDSQGEIMFDQTRFENVSPQDAVRMGISLVPEERRIFREQTVEDNLKLGAYVRRRAPRAEVLEDYERVYGLFPILKERRKQNAGTLSGGQQQMLAIACGLMAKPKLLLLDEPSLGLAPKIISELWAVLFELKQSGLTILLVEQNARLAFELSDYIYILKNGHIVVDGTCESVRDSDVVKGAYF